MSPMTVAAAWLLRAGDERGNCGHQTESTVVREMAQEARWRGFQTARQREGLERGPPALFRSWNAVRLWNRGRWGLSHFLSGICPVGPFWVVRREGPGPGGPREGWYPGVDRLAREEPGSLGGDPPLLTCRCSRSSSSFTFSTWAASAVESRSTWCLGGAGRKMKGLSLWDWPFTLPRWEAGGVEQPGIPRLGSDPLAEQEKA